MAKGCRYSTGCVIAATTGTSSSTPLTCCSWTRWDLRREPIEDRKAELAKLLRHAKSGLQLNEHISEPGDIVFRHACKLGLEGIVSKRKGSPYRSGRSHDFKSRTRKLLRSGGRRKRIGDDEPKSWLARLLLFAFQCKSSPCGCHCFQNGLHLEVGSICQHFLAFSGEKSAL
jgi:hypothetical protein